MGFHINEVVFDDAVDPCRIAEAKTEEERKALMLEQTERYWAWRERFKQANPDLFKEPSNLSKMVNNGLTLSRSTLRFFSRIFTESEQTVSSPQGEHSPRRQFI